MKYPINHEFVSISSQTATHRIILMHGWGADYDDLLTFGKEMTEKINLDFELIDLVVVNLYPFKNTTVFPFHLDVIQGPSKKLPQNQDLFFQSFPFQMLKGHQNQLPNHASK